MNKQRRKALEKALEMLDEAYSVIENVRDEEQEAFDNMPEGLQASERGEQMEEYISILEDATYNIDDIRDQITEIVEG